MLGNYLEIWFEYESILVCASMEFVLWTITYYKLLMWQIAFSKFGLNLSFEEARSRDLSTCLKLNRKITIFKIQSFTKNGFDCFVHHFKYSNIIILTGGRKIYIKALCTQTGCFCKLCKSRCAGCYSMSCMRCSFDISSFCLV